VGGFFFGAGGVVRGEIAAEILEHELGQAFLFLGLEEFGAGGEGAVGGVFG
jgi:hypothetical protein